MLVKLILQKYFISPSFLVQLRGGFKADWRLSHHLSGTWMKAGDTGNHAVMLGRQNDSHGIL